MAEAELQISAPIERVAPDTIRLERTLDAPAGVVSAVAAQKMASASER